MYKVQLYRQDIFFYIQRAMPRVSAAYKNQLDQLECHFTWLKDHPITPTEVDNIITRLREDKNTSPNIYMTSLAFLSYLHTRPSANMSTDTALACLKQAEEMEASFLCVNCEFVLRANQLHVLNIKGEVHKEKLAMLLKEWEDRKQTPPKEAGVWGTKAITLSRLGLPSYEKAIGYFEQASELDKENAQWYFGKALLTGRIRRVKQGARQRPSKEELQLFDMANKITKGNSVYLAGYAYALAEFVKNCRRKTRLTTERKQKSLTLVSEALQHAGNSHETYRQCAKVYRWFGMVHEFERCIDKGVDSCEIKHKLLHLLALHFRNTNRLDLAIEVLTEAVGNIQLGTGNVYAELDLVLMKIKQSSEYDPMDDFHNLESKYCSPNKGDTFKIALRRETGKYYITHGQSEAGLQRLLEAVEIENSNQTFGQRIICANEIVRFLEDRINAQRNVDTLYDLAFFYQNLTPETPTNLQKAKAQYKDILEMDALHQDSLINLGKVLTNRATHISKAEEKRILLDDAMKYLSKARPDTEVVAAKAGCLLALAKISQVSDERKSLFMQSIELGCRDGIMDMMKILETEMEDKPDETFHYEVLYHRLSHIIKTGSGKEVESFDIMDVSDELHSRYKNMDKYIIEMTANGFTRTLRRCRLDMCLTPNHDTANDVIRESRFFLDRIHRQFGEAIFPESKSGKYRCLFPIASKSTPGDLSSIRHELERMIVSPKEQHGWWENFTQVNHQRYQPLLDGMVALQAEYYDVLKNLFRLVNIDKHERELVRDDYIIDGLDTESDAVGLAQKIATFTEKMVHCYKRFM